MKKLVGMQIVVEGLALYSFREMRNLTEEPLLKELLTYVARDESRHHAYGVQYVERCVPVPQRRRARRARGLRARGGADPDRQPQPAGPLHGAAADLGRGRHRRRPSCSRACTRERDELTRDLPQRAPARPGAGLRDPDAAPLRAAQRARRDALPRVPAREPRQPHRRRGRRGVPAHAARSAGGHGAPGCWASSPDRWARSTSSSAA